MAKKKKTQRRAKPRRGAVVRRKRVVYRKMALTKSGKRTKIERAFAYVIFYGKKALLTKKFPPTIRGREKRLRFLDLLVARIEKKRLEKIRTKRQAKAQTTRIRKRLLSEKNKLDVVEQVSIAQNSYPDFSRIRFEMARVHPTITPEGILASPMIPIDKISKSEFIEKVVLGIDNILRRLRILKLTLNDSIYMNAENFEEVVYDLYYMFLPHIFMFWKDTKSFTKKYHLRISYESPGGMRSGMSVVSIEVDSYTMCEKLLEMTFNRFRGDIVLPFESLARRNKDYLADGGEVFITGFSFQAREGK